MQEDLNRLFLEAMDLKKGVDMVACISGPVLNSEHLTKAEFEKMVTRTSGKHFYPLVTDVTEQLTCGVPVKKETIDLLLRCIASKVRESFPNWQKPESRIQER
jgi:hypothetical protein